MNIEGIRNFLGLAWKEVSSWGSGIDFSFYDHLEDRIDQLEQELVRAKQAPRDPMAGALGMQQLERCC
jgi:DNA replication initiation complex subunit (GINS family)